MRSAGQNTRPAPRSGSLDDAAHLVFVTIDFADNVVSMSLDSENAFVPKQTARVTYDAKAFTNILLRAGHAGTRYSYSGIAAGANPGAVIDFARANPIRSGGGGNSFAAWMAANGTDPYADPDRDGIPHIQIYALGLENLPATAPLAGQPFGILNGENDAWFDLTFPVHSDLATSGITIVQEFSNDLKQWSAEGIAFRRDFTASGLLFHSYRVTQEVAATKVGYTRLKFLYTP
jgi:hypothetical protein